MWEKENRLKGKQFTKKMCKERKREKKNGKRRNVSWTKERKLEIKKDENKENVG